MRKLVVLGGSSQSTPWLLDSLGKAPEALLDEVVLVGRDAEALAGVARAGRMVLPSRETAIRTVSFEDRAAAFDGAETVLVQIRPGGYEGRAFDESFPLRFGIPSDEGLGPSGLSAAWRTWPFLRALLGEARAHVPDATIVMLTSPLGLLVKAATAAFPELRVVGICELPWMTLRDIATELRFSSVAELELGYLGVNHVGWLFDPRSTGRDVLGDYAAARAGSPTFPSGELVRRLDAVPTKWLRLHYERDAVLKEQIARGQTRGEELQKIRHGVRSTLSGGDRNQVKAAMARRPAPWYAHAVVPYLAAQRGQDLGVRLFLSVPNRGYVPGLGEGDVLEIPHWVRDGELQRIHLPRVPPDLLRALSEWVEYERSASSAVLSRDERMIREALRMHPWVEESERLVESLAVSICRQSF